jgi:hypothetical protein
MRILPVARTTLLSTGATHDRVPQAHWRRGRRDCNRHARVLAEVVAATREKQVLWDYSSLVGEVFLVR